MFKKDFIALADELRGLKIPKNVLDAIVRFCKGRSSSFKAELWLSYLRGDCGPCGGKVKVRS